MVFGDDEKCEGVVQVREWTVNLSQWSLSTAANQLFERNIAILNRGALYAARTGMVRGVAS